MNASDVAERWINMIMICQDRQSLAEVSSFKQFLILIHEGGLDKFLEIKIWTTNCTQKFEAKLGRDVAIIELWFFVCFWQTLQVKVSKLDFLSFHNSHYLTHSHRNVWKIREFELKSINKKLRFYDGLKMRIFSESVSFWEVPII